jgi:hypothetical protein
MDKEQMFSAFRPYCAALATKPSKEILEKLSKLVSQSDPVHLTELQEYILFPCQLYLRTPVLPENYTLQVLKFVEQFFSRESVELNSAFLMTDLLQSILQLDSKSEDLKIGVCDCLASLVKSSTVEVKSVLFGVEQKLAVSHLVFQVLEWSQIGVRPLILSSLNLIDSLCIVDRVNEKLYRQFVDDFCQMLPGITTKLVKTLQQQDRNSDKNKIGFSNKIIVKCLSVWRRYVVAIFCHENVETDLVDKNIETDLAENNLAEISDKCQLLTDQVFGIDKLFSEYYLIVGLTHLLFYLFSTNTKRYKSDI